MSDATLVPARVRPSHLAAVVMGNALEFYDFLVYATFAVYIGRAYFPAHDPTTSLLLSLATFGIGFVTRPLGGVFIGWLGDRIGRRPALLLSFALMGLSIAGLALTPSYAQIGLAAPIIAVLCRLGQGLAVGGEVGPCTAFLVECGAPGRRGLIASLQGASQGLATLAAALVGVGLTASLPEPALASWGWRVALLLGVVIVPFGLIVRRTLPETLERAPERHAPRPANRDALRVAALGFCLITAGTVGSYVQLYLPTLAIHDLHMPPRVAFGTGVITGASILVFSLVGGWLSDGLGRKPVMIAGLGLSLLVTVPVFLLMREHPSVWTLYLGAAAMTVPGSIGSGAMLTAITESLPPGIRSTTLGSIYALAVAVFGGTTQFVIAWLIQQTGDPVSPAWYRVAMGLVGLGAMLLMRESAPSRAEPTSPAALIATAAA